MCRATRWPRRRVARQLGALAPERLLLMPAVAAASTSAAFAGMPIYVDVNGPLQGDGLSWTTAFRDLQTALAAATSGDEIRVADGTYRPTSGLDRTISFMLKSGVTVAGGYAGVGAADPDARDIALFPTILSGNLGNAASTADDSYRVVRAEGLAAGTALDGVTVRDGAAAGTTAETQRGGGITVLGGTLTIRHCAVRNNLCVSGGAGIYSTGALTIDDTLFTLDVDQSGGLGNGGAIWLDAGSSATFTSCTISSSSTNGAGGAIYATSSNLMLLGCVVTDCSSSDRGAGIYCNDTPTTLNGTQIKNCYSTYFGGGVFISGGTLAVAQCTFSNSGSNEGGGISAWPGSGLAQPCTIIDSTFSGNTAAYWGGGLHSTRPVVVRNCQFLGNNAASSGSTGYEYGGGAASVDGDLPAFDVEAAFIGCVFKDNTAPLLTSGSTDAVAGGVRVRANALFENCRFLANNGRRGGGIEVGSFGKATVVNCEFSGNVAKVRGGAAFNDGADLILVNSTVANNTVVSGAAGAGIVASGTSPYTRLANSILWGNTVGGATTLAAQLLDEAAGSPKVDYCTIQSLPVNQTLGGVGNSGTNPLFVAANGPDGVPGTLDDNFSLQPGSPAIDSGADSLVPLDTLDLDADGVTAEFLPIDIVGAQRMRDSGGSAMGCGIAGAPLVDRGAREAAGRGSMPMYGDFDGNGLRNSADLTILLSAWGLCPNACCAADLDGDGFVSTLDLGLLLGLPWSPYP